MIDFDEKKFQRRLEIQIWGDVHNFAEEKLKKLMNEEAGESQAPKPDKPEVGEKPAPNITEFLSTLENDLDK